MYVSNLSFLSFCAFLLLSFSFPCSWIYEKDVKDPCKARCLRAMTRNPLLLLCPAPPGLETRTHREMLTTRWRCAPGYPAWPLCNWGALYVSAALGLWGEVGQKSLRTAAPLWTQVPWRVEDGQERAVGMSLTEQQCPS